MRRSLLFAIPALLFAFACTEPPTDDPATEGSALIGQECAVERPYACGPGRLCTFEFGARVGLCMRTGELGGPCGGTVSGFSGGDCQPGLVCELGTFAYSLDGRLIAREQANPSTGICRRPPGTSGVCDLDRACGFGETCRRPAGSSRGVCRPPGLADAGAPADAGVDAGPPPCSAMSDCARPRVCTFAPGAYTGACRVPGEEGGLCGSTYSGFAGGSCRPGLRCEIGRAAFPTNGLPATDQGWNVGVCTR